MRRIWGIRDFARASQKASLSRGLTNGHGTERADNVRTTTRLWHRQTAKHRFAALRRGLRMVNTAWAGCSAGTQLVRLSWILVRIRRPLDQPASRDGLTQGGPVEKAHFHGGKEGWIDILVEADFRRRGAFSFYSNIDYFQEVLTACLLPSRWLQQQALLYRIEVQDQVPQVAGTMSGRREGGGWRGAR